MNDLLDASGRSPFCRMPCQRDDCLTQTVEDELELRADVETWVAGDGELPPALSRAR